MKRKIYRSMVLTVTIAVVCIGLMLMLTMYQLFTRQLRTSLSGELNFLAAAMDQIEDPAPLFDELDDSKTRLTWIDEEGRVLYDSASDADKMENHLLRPEVQDTLESGSGSSRRYSATLGQETHYFATRLANGNILRLSGTQTSVLGMLLQMLQLFIVIVVSVTVLSMIISSRITSSIIRPLNHLNLDDPANNVVYEELTPLLASLSSKNRQIAQQMFKLQKQQIEFAAITENMSEGLLLLNGRGGVLSMNRSAMMLFDAEGKAFSGEYVLMLHRNLELSRVVNAAIEGRASTQIMELNGRHYELIATPVLSGEGSAVTGIVLLIPDITHRYDAEKMRREFTANVSHELKTPLTSILGYTELILNGMVPPEGTQECCTNIYNSAKQLLQLIDDTIRLSHLDESSGRKIELEPVSLSTIARNTCESLKLLAEQKGIQLSVGGDECTVQGSPRLLQEAIYNLVDNAIKYNVTNGSVTVQTKNTPEGVVVRVSDTGIGISLEHHGKIFERFYCVDKSHSRETGGTGLGLSIVKHVVQLHNAQLRVKSTPGKGTEITMTFPA